MKPRPSFVDHGYIEVNRAQSLRLLLVESSFLEITSVSVIHTRHMIGSRAAWDEGNRLFSGRHRLLMATLKCPNIADDCVGFGAVQCRFVGRRPLLSQPNRAWSVRVRPNRYSAGVKTGLISRARSNSARACA